MRTLRQRPRAAAPARSGQSTLFMGTSLTAACLAGITFAQEATDEGAIVLPTLDVETTAAPEPAAAPAPRAAAKPRRVAAPRPAPQVCTPELAGTPVCAAQEAAEAQAAAEAAAQAAAEAQARAGTNPNADPDAPFRAVTSANPLLRGEVADMPRTLTAVTKEVLDTTNVTSVRQLARSTPGVSLGFGEGGNAYGDNIYIRGFKANNDIYVDGVRDPGVSVRETFDTEQVEITKGPSGSVGGRGATGGTLNVTTKQPQDVDFYRFSTEYSSAKTIRSTFDINLATSDRLQLRFNGMYQRGEVAGRDEAYDNREGAAVALKYKLTDDVTLDASYSYSHFDQMPDWGVPFTSAGPGGASGPVTEFGVDRGTFYGVADRDFQDTQRHVATARLTWDINGNLAFTNTLRAARTVNDYILTAPGSVDENGSPDPADWTTGVRDKSRYTEVDVIANTAQLTGEADWGGVSHSFATGLVLQKETVRQDSYPGSTEDYPTGARGCTVDVVSPNTDPCWAGVMPSLSGNVTKTDVQTISAYFVDRIELSPQWALDAGIRLDHYQVDREGVDRSGAAYALSRTDTMWNGNLGLTFKPREDLTLYGSVATSANPMGQEIASGGGFYGGLDTGGATLAPERNVAYELGAKYELNDDLLLTAALFQTTKMNAREDVGPRGAQVTQDSLKYRLRGVELGVAGKVDRLGLYGGAVFMTSEVLESADTTAIGQSVATIAHKQFNMLATYDVTDQLMLGVQTNWKDDVDLGTLTPNGNVLPAYWSFDLVGSYDVNDSMGVRFGVKNLTDTVYYDTAYRSGEPFTYVAPGREIWAAVDLKF
ncbi:TonB-dependent receptor [Tropicibacter naphthalenivorans]|uniref:Virulence-associated outer membrane protein Vir-90 n=1 Tax=Tropicibacter naphthalenivorans TaxID=441103 RepID=A0A0P1GGR7_9RHOB|nr:TonB-dependent siderophore receptor [Tropicibacter naphthalenivorans]CUH81006.1 Virulence-associated outer membrane protein Vir-90 [Tropicibacter naphthalenivorans]SMC91881.1 catecholate siderophore receptor [Tropicibacter naphthalenivorans]